MSGTIKRYWVVGGMFRDTAFDTLIRGTERLVGPFADRDEARRAWRRLADETRSACNIRFTIAEESERRPNHALEENFSSG